MPKSRLLLCLLTLVGLFSLTAVAFAVVTTVTVDATIDDTQLVDGRIFRDGIPSDCSGKAFPGVFATGVDFGYTVHGPYVAESTGCVTVNFDPDTVVGACTTNAHAQAFLDDFVGDWAIDELNYLGDVGSSLAQPFSFPINAGESFVIAVTNTSSVQACNYHFDFTYDLVGEAPAPVVSAGCTLPVPSGSVVGDVPFETQIFWEPGKASPGLTLKAGTYIVTGQDETESYYQIVLACQFVWVSKDAVQPSFQPPQNGAALPTQIVEGGGSSSNVVPSASDV